METLTQSQAWQPLGITTGLEPYAGDFNVQDAVHLFRRTLFGVKKDEVDLAVVTGLSATLDRLLEEHPLPLPVNDYNRDDLKDPNVPFGQTWVDDHTDNGDLTSARIVSLKAWWIDQMMNQQPSLQQKMMLFWHNHFATQTWGVFWANQAYRHFKLLHEQAFGNFKVLTRAITTDPQMLLYLNGAFNNKESPDENYGRELQELFCIGKGPNSNYSEEDVKMAAKVLTGWTIQWEGTYPSYFNYWLHDQSDKEFSSFYGGKVIKGKYGPDGAKETDELMDMIFDNPETALFICRKIYRFFVYPYISEETEQNIIVPLASILRDNNYEMVPVLRTLLNSAHFFDLELRGAMIKSPVDFFIGFWRSMLVSIPENASVKNNLEIRTSSLWQISNLGQQLMDPPNVAGWPAYYQYPQYDKSWITTDSVPRRALTTDSFIYWGFWSETLLTNVDLLAFIDQLDNPDQLNPMLDEILDLLLAVPVSELQRNQMKSILLSGQANEGYWNQAWFAYKLTPYDEMARMTVENRVKPFFQYLFQLSEYHLQ